MQKESVLSRSTIVQFTSTCMHDYSLTNLHSFLSMLVAIHNEHKNKPLSADYIARACAGKVLSGNSLFLLLLRYVAQPFIIAGR
jgi:hypothetical protein